MAVVHEGDALAGVGGGVAQGELGAAHGVGLHADAEYLGLHAGLDLVEVKGLGENLVNGLLVAHPGAHAVGGDVLEAVAGPDVHDAGLTQFLGQVLADADAGPAVVNPEAAGLLIGGGQGEGVALGVGEEGGVEVAAQAPRPAEVHPLLEVLGLQPVPVHPAAVFVVKDGVAGVEIELLHAGAQLEDQVDVGHQFLGSAGPAGVVAGGLDAAGEGLGGVGVKAADVVALPAVEGDGSLHQALHGLLGVHTQSGVFLFRFVIHMQPPAAEYFPGRWPRGSR